jgi:thiamine biosynthesis protein ThiS
MRIQLNGEPVEIEPGTTVRKLLEDRKLSPAKVAVELNRRLLRSDKYDTPLQPDDRVEVVTFVGGG